jgi:hypothetical protein
MARTRLRVLAVVGTVVVLGGVLLMRTSSSPADNAYHQQRPIESDAPASTSVPAADGPSAGESDSDGDREGAVAAALDLAAAAQDWLYLSDEDLETAVRAVAAPTSADRLVEQIIAEVGLARDALARSPGRVWWVVSPLASRVDTFTPGRAQVSVWTVSVLSAADVAMPQSDWTTTVSDLEWDGIRWRLISVLDTPGPTPQIGGRDEAWEPEPFDDSLSGFTRIGAEEVS